ncbi:MAG: cobalamin-dependent protein, partial [Anoxybacillus ayderensis]|nr:cobalamin-dependent protein [Anoxybacillus ayderensis]
NLVDIILSNNGFHVVDLGIKVTPQQLIEAVRNEQPDMIGLSGLLVKSAQQMVLTAQDLKQAGISLPILVGGAALSRKFTDTKIAPEYDGIVLYAKDAMEGLTLANRIVQQDISYEKKEKTKQTIERQSAVAVMTKSNVKREPIYVPTDTERHILQHIPLSHIEPYVNWQMLLGHHLGLKGNVKKLLAEGNEKAIMLKDLIDELLAEAKQTKSLSPKAVYQFFPARSDGDTIIIYDPHDQQTVIETFTFPRQTKAPYLCLADYLSNEQIDYVGLFAVTAGAGVRDMAQRLKEEGQFLKSHAIQALALELAEGLAERVHQIMRDRWGFPDSPDFTMEQRFAAKYQGQRFSFGYPACPNLEDQEKLFRLLRPEEIGIHLTEGYMMEPEASVSAIVFAHPEARYFNVL